MFQTSQILVLIYVFFFKVFLKSIWASLKLFLYYYDKFWLFDKQLLG